jgi:hypothetical protein
LESIFGIFSAVFGLQPAIFSARGFTDPHILKTHAEHGTTACASFSWSQSSGISLNFCRAECALFVFVFHRRSIALLVEGKVAHYAVVAPGSTGSMNYLATPHFFFVDEAQFLSGATHIVRV